MIVDRHHHNFDNCPACKGLALLIPVGEDHGSVMETRKANNLALAEIAKAWLRKNHFDLYQEWIIESNGFTLEAVA